jgi:hypothetical protein
MRTAQDMVSAGASDQAVGDAVGVSRASAERHRKRHLRPIVEALAQGAQKDAPARQQRKKIIETVTSGGPPDPSTLLSLSSLTLDLRKALDRIERASDKAEQNGQLTVLSGLLQQLHRNIEGRAKLAGHGGFAASKTQIGIGVGGGRPFEPFVLQLNIGDRPDTLVLAPQDAPPFEVLDADTKQPFDRHSKEPRDLLFVPKGHPTAAPVIDHEPSDIEQAAAPAANDADQVDGDMDIDNIIASVFDKPLPDDAGRSNRRRYPRAFGQVAFLAAHKTRCRVFLTGGTGRRLYETTPNPFPIAQRPSAEQFHARLRPNNATTLSGIDWLWSAKRA